MYCAVTSEYNYEWFIEDGLSNKVSEGLSQECNCQSSVVILETSTLFGDVNYLIS